jgi:hypothetical protein
MFSPKLQCNTKAESTCLISIPLVHLGHTPKPLIRFWTLDTVSGLIRARSHMFRPPRKVDQLEGHGRTPNRRSTTVPTEVHPPRLSAG